MKKILCLGDSLTTGYPEYTIYGNIEAIYGYWMKKFTDEWLLKNGIDEEIEFINAGEAGDTLPRMASRLMGYSNYDSVIIIGGGNDVIQGKSPASILINFEQLYNEVNDNAIVFCGLLPPVSKDFEQSLEIKTYNEMLLDYLEDTEIHEILTYNLNDCDGYLKPEYGFGDGVHLNVLGYKKMAEGIFSVFKERYLSTLLHQINQ